MKSYKDLDKEIILNAPEGTMWVSDSDGYYKYNSGKMFLYDSKQRWDSCFDHNLTDWRVSEHNLIPLPNIEIPWEATADSVCPVPGGIKCDVIFGNNAWLARSIWPEECIWSNQDKITAYKIIDEEFLDRAKPAQEEPINVPELEMHRAAYQAIKNAGFESPEELLAQHKCLLDKVADASEDKLTKRLKFLQNLANQFPEIRNEAIKFMACELDGYMNTLWEKDNDE